MGSNTIWHMCHARQMRLHGVDTCAMRFTALMRRALAVHSTTVSRDFRECDIQIMRMCGCESCREDVLTAGFLPPPQNDK